MTLYGYQCRECGQEYTSTFRGDVLREVDDFVWSSRDCTQCGHDEVKRRYSIAVHRPMHEHMNKTTNTLISSSRQFRDELARKSEAEEKRTGIPCNYVPIDPDEARQVVIDSDAVGLDATNRVRVNEGKAPIRIGSDL